MELYLFKHIARSLKSKRGVEYNALMLLYSEEGKDVDMFGAKDKEQLQDLVKIIGKSK